MQAKCKLCKPVLSEEVKVFWYLRLMMCVFDFWCMCTHLNPPPQKKTLQAKCKSCKPVLSQVKVFWYQGVDLRRWPIYSHLQKACEVIVRNMWGKCMCKHLNHAPPLACEIGQKTLQARCKPNASYASLSCQRLKSFDTQVWILGGGPYVHITTSMWGHCEEHVKQCEEHVRWVWGTSEDNVRGSVRNMWGVGNLTTLILSVIANVMPVSNRNHQTSLIKEWLSDVW